MIPAMDLVFGFSAEVWEHDGDAAWHFLTVPGDESDEIRELAPTRRGFGSVRVAVEIGDTRWHTSVFPDATSGCYVLPVKREVREREGIDAGDVVDVALTVVTG